MRKGVVFLFMIMAVFLVQGVHAYLIWDDDLQYGETGSWAYAYVQGDWYGGLVHNVRHQWQWYFAEGYYGEVFLLGQPPEGGSAVKAWTQTKIDVYIGGMFVETVSALATIPVQ